MSRSVLPIVTDRDRAHFGGRTSDSQDQLDGDYNTRVLETVALHVAPAIG